LWPLSRAQLRVGGKARAAISTAPPRCSAAPGVAGGGVALLNAADSAKKGFAELEGDEKTGTSIILRALEEPLRQLAYNAGLEGSVVVDKVRSAKKGQGLNVDTGEIEDLVKAGIIDPTMVTRSALQNAASIAPLPGWRARRARRIPADQAPAAPQRPLHAHLHAHDPARLPQPRPHLLDPGRPLLPSVRDAARRRFGDGRPGDFDPVGAGRVAPPPLSAAGCAGSDNGSSAGVRPTRRRNGHTGGSRQL
jgi:hypothetical protein